MIADERMSAFIDSLDTGNTPFLNRIEEEAIRTNVPIIRTQVQSLIKLLLALHKPASILEVGCAIGFSALLMSEYAPKDCQITTIKQDDELGTVVTTDIGDNYTVSYGQLDNVSVNKGDVLKEGDVIGTVAKPTKYYTEEGSNLFFQVENGKETVDPMLLLR